MDAIDNWLEHAVIPVQALDPDNADIVVLGELNHFIHEKSDFRLALAPTLLAQGYDIWGEELGWSDGTRIDRYMRTRDEAIFDRIALFGYRGDARQDRDDSPTGIFRESLNTYPFALMRAEQQRFYLGLHARAYFGFDVAAGHDGVYADIADLLDNAPLVPADWRRHLLPVAGERSDEEIARLQALRSALPALADGRLAAALSARIDGLTYSALVRDAQSYEATRPAMAMREQAMKRRFAEMRALYPGQSMVLMGHAVHLAKDDSVLDIAGAVGAGGNRVPSLGHHVNQEMHLKTFVIWMVYGGGTDSQPLKDLPRTASYPPDTLNARLAARFTVPTLISTAGAPSTPMPIGHLYNLVMHTPLAGQVDALYFVPRVSPMREG